LASNDDQVNSQAAYSLTQADGPDSIPHFNVSLLAHEFAGGHTIKKHVGKKLSYLMGRTRNDPDVSTASSFKSLGMASMLVNLTLNSNAAGVQSWSKLPLQKNEVSTLTINSTYNKPTGYSITGGKNNPTDVYNVRMVLIRPAATAESFLVLTAFPY
jgi:hypothetical protein